MYTLIVSDTKIKLHQKGVIIATNCPIAFEGEYDAKIESLQGDEWIQRECVWKLLDQYNNCVQDILREESWKYEDGYQIEGGDLAQPFSDAILIKHIFCELFDRYEIKKMYLYISESNLNECLVALNMAHNRNVDVKICYVNLEVFMKAMIHPLAKVLMLGYMNLRRVKRFADLKKKESCDNDCRHYDVGVCIGSNAKKHYYWNLELLKIVRSKIDNYAVICFDKGDTYQKCIEDSFNAVNLGDCIDKIYLKEIVKEYKFFRKEMKKRGKIAWTIEDENFSEFINRQININIHWRATDNLCKIIAVKSFLCNYTFRYIRGHGGGDFIENRAFYYLSKNLKRNSILFRAEEASMEFVEKYGKNENIIKLRYVEKNSDISNEVRELGVEMVEIPSEACRRREHVVGKRESIDVHNIKVLWCPSYVLRGYGSKQVFDKNNLEIMELTHICNNIELYVKYHPNQDEREVQKYRKLFPKVHFYEKNMFIGECIASADIVVTDKSTLILDAIAMSKPVVSIIATSNEKKFISNILDYLLVYDSVYNFYEDFASNATSNTKMNLWMDGIVEKQKGYFSDASDNTDSFLDIVVDDLYERLKDNK